jgi:GNAT superfamily N-acetyltransferase
MMIDPELREATAADATVLVGLIHAAFEEYRGQLVPPSSAHHETAACIRSKLNASHAVLMSVDKRPVGCVFYEVSARGLYLSRLSVLPAERGKGFGRILMQRVEARALELNRPRVRLGVRIALGPLRARYERLGYHQVDARAHQGLSEPTRLRDP